MELPRDPSSLFILCGEDRAGQVPCRLRGVPQLMDGRTEQQHGNRQAGEEDLQRQNVGFRIGADKESRSFQRWRISVTSSGNVHSGSAARQIVPLAVTAKTRPATTNLRCPIDLKARPPCCRNSVRRAEPVEIGEHLAIRADPPYITRIGNKYG